MNNFKTLSAIITKTAILLMMVFLMVLPVNAMLIFYSSMIKVFEDSEYAVTGVISKSELIVDPETFFICGQLLTIDNPVINWRDKKKSKRPSSMQFAHFGAFNSDDRDVGKSVVIFGNTLDLSRSDTDEPINPKFFSPRNPYIYPINPVTGKGIFVDCSKLYPDSLKYETTLKFDITTYQMTDQIGTRKGHDKSFDVVEIRPERLNLIQDSSFIKAIRGWKKSGRTTLCLTEDVCLNEIELIKTPIGVLEGGNFEYNVSLFADKYLIDVDMLFDVYDAHNSTND